MNMEYLRLFDAVAQAGSITGAAERLFASQPAISRQLARLERNLGVRLFDRMPRGVKLTRAGDLLRGYARRIFSTEVEAAEAIAEFRGLRRGRLHLGASLTIGSYLLPGILAQYCRGYPEIAVTLEIANTHDIQEQLLSAELDMAFTEGLVQSEELEAVVFAHDELIAVAPAGHAITRARRVTAARFCALPLILRERGSGTRLHSERALMQLGLQCRPILELGSAEAIKRAVRNGLEWPSCRNSPPPMNCAPARW